MLDIVVVNQGCRLPFQVVSGAPFEFTYEQFGLFRHGCVLVCCHVFVSVIQIVPCMLRSLERNVCLRMRTCCKCITWCELFEVLNVAQACTRHNSCVSMGGGIASVMHRHCLFSVLGYRCDCVNVLLVLFCSGAIVVLPVLCCF